MPTFRDADGLWEGHRVEDVATPEAFERQPSVVHQFYDARRAALTGVEPNPAHLALARLEDAVGDGLLVITQNIDDLHERAGSTRVLHMHGALRSALCRACGTRVEWEGDLGDFPPCPACHEMERIFAALEQAELFVSIGTSGAVYPAAGFVEAASAYGARTLELNLVPSDGSHFFDEARHGPAGELVPAWVTEVLG